MKIPRKYDLKGLSVHLIVGGPVPPVLEAHGQNLGLSAMWTVGGCGRSGGRHTLMLHLFLNSHPAVPPLLQATSIPASPAASPEPEDKVCGARNASRRVARILLNSWPDATEKSPAPKTLDEFSHGRKKEVGAECCKEADMALHCTLSAQFLWAGALDNCWQTCISFCGRQEDCWCIPKRRLKQSLRPHLTPQAGLCLSSLSSQTAGSLCSTEFAVWYRIRCNQSKIKVLPFMALESQDVAQSLYESPLPYGVQLNRAKIAG